MKSSEIILWLQVGKYKSDTRWYLFSSVKRMNEVLNPFKLAVKGLLFILLPHFLVHSSLTPSKSFSPHFYTSVSVCLFLYLFLALSVCLLSLVSLSFLPPSFFSQECCNINKRTNPQASSYTRNCVTFVNDIFFRRRRQFSFTLK